MPDLLELAEWAASSPMNAAQEIAQLRDALEWINAEPEDPIKVQKRALAALGRGPAFDEERKR